MQVAGLDDGRVVGGDDHDRAARGLLAELAELREEAARGAVVVVATHDPAVVEAWDLHIALDEGRVIR